MKTSLFGAKQSNGLDTPTDPLTPLEPRVGTLPGKNPMPIVRVFIEEGCIPCSYCSAECPEVFDEVPYTALVREGAEAFFETRKRAIEDSAYGCPVAVIKVVYSDGTSLGYWSDDPPTPK